MPRVTLTYDLPREETEFRDAISGAEFAAVLLEIRRVCRRNLADADTAHFGRDVLETILRMMPQEIHE